MTIFLVILAAYVVGLAVTIFLTAGIEKRRTPVGIFLWALIYVFWPASWAIFILLGITGKLFQNK